MASNTEKTSPPAFGEGLRPTGTSLDPVDVRPEPGPMTAAWGSCPAARHPGELLTRSDVCHVHADRAAAERCGVLLGGAPELVRLDKVPARGLPRGVVAVERNERPATSPPPGLGQPCWRRAVSSARRASTGRTRRPPPRELRPDAAQVIGRRGRRQRTAAVNRCGGQQPGVVVEIADYPDPREHRFRSR